MPNHSLGWARHDYITFSMCHTWPWFTKYGGSSTRERSIMLAPYATRWLKWFGGHTFYIILMTLKEDLHRCQSWLALRIYNHRKESCLPIAIAGKGKHPHPTLPLLDKPQTISPRRHCGLITFTLGLRPSAFVCSMLAHLCSFGVGVIGFKH